MRAYKYLLRMSCNKMMANNNKTIDLDKLFADEFASSKAFKQASTSLEGAVAPVRSKQVNNIYFPSAAETPTVASTLSSSTSSSTANTSSTANATSKPTATVWAKNFLPGRKKPTLADAKARLNLGNKSVITEV